MILLTTKDILDDQGKKIDEKVVRQDTSYMVHAVQTGAKYGLSYHFGRFKGDKGTIFNVDSLLQSLNLDEQNILVLNMDLGAPDQSTERKRYCA